jgi:hypothetical protein
MINSCWTSHRAQAWRRDRFRSKTGALPKLSTLQQAVDLDYGLVVVRDCCADPDAEVHAMLLDMVIAKQAVVVTTAEFGRALRPLHIQRRSGGAPRHPALPTFRHRPQ